MNALAIGACAACLSFPCRCSRLSIQATSRPCLCGGVITATSLALVDVVAAVRRHQATPRHARWSARVFGS
jgi:hypothetical protein